jgi:hypothetical protein
VIVKRISKALLAARATKQPCFTGKLVVYWVRYQTPGKGASQGATPTFEAFNEIESANAGDSFHAIGQWISFPAPGCTGSWAAGSNVAATGPNVQGSLLGLNPAFLRAATSRFVKSL